jgi:putative tryptophan/tyrosine transport system substrate-binding protein
MIRRCEFIAGLGGATAAWPLAALAQQQSVVPLVGYLRISPPDVGVRALTAFRKGLGETGENFQCSNRPSSNLCL